MSEFGDNERPGERDEIPKFLFADFFGDVGYRALFLSKFGFVGDSDEVISTGKLLIEDFETGEKLFYRELNLSAMLSLVSSFLDSIEQNLSAMDRIGIRTLSLPTPETLLSALSLQSKQCDRIRDLLLRTTENYRKNNDNENR